MGLTMSATREWGRFNINANSVCYGLVETRRAAFSKTMQKAKSASRRPMMPHSEKLMANGPSRYNPSSPDEYRRPQPGKFMRLSSGLSLSASAVRSTNCLTSPTSANNPA